MPPANLEGHPRGKPPAEIPDSRRSPWKVSMTTELRTGDRLDSLDALRGFDMLWITGGELLITGLRDLTGWPFFRWASEQLEHVPWEGFHCYDLIFPLFLFISGVTIPIAVSRRRARGQSDRDLLIRFVRRALLLVFLGMVYNGLLKFDWANTRYPSVLGRIGLGYFFAALIVTRSSIRTQAIWAGGLLLLYWAAMMLIPVPGFGAGVITPEGNLEGYVDRLLLPGKFYFATYDPEGVLSTVPSISTALMGALAGHLLLSMKMNGKRKALVLALAGVGSLGVGQLWGVGFPVIKNIWSSSFVLVAGGWSLILLSVFYLVVDVWGWKKWAFLFVIIGVNPLTIYLTQAGMVNYESTVSYFFDGVLRFFSDPCRLLLWAIALLTLKMLFLYFLYRKKIFLRV
jgi:predicted acyltransferase